MDMDSAPIDVEGCLMGGDGSGGEHPKDPRIRRCGFGLVVLEPETNASGDREQLLGDQSSLPLIRMLYYGSAPGTQNSYRAEATVLLHALTYTNGNACLVLDCKGVIRQHNKGPRANLKHDGLLWAAIFRARQARLARGGGVITLIWTPSHKSYHSPEALCSQCHC